MRLPWRGNLIAGRFVRPAAGRPIVSDDPGDLGHPVGTIWSSVAAVEPAVVAADGARHRWARASFGQRLRVLTRFQRVVRQRAPMLTRLIAREMGKPLWEAVREVDRFAARVDETATAAWPRIQPYAVEVSRGVRGECRYHPHGVVAILGPFNFPAHLPGSQFLPALLTGNTVVFKPSELTPFVGQALAECVVAAGVPAGVFNVVQGDGTVGQALVQHPLVRAVFFTGSAATGRRIQEALFVGPAKSVALEMGGKNAALILEDAEVMLAAREAALGAFSMTGQRCNATSRLIVHRKIAAQFLEAFLQVADQLTIGYPLEPGVFMGPLVSRAAVAKFQAASRQARREGYRVLRAGGVFPVAGRRGYYVRPSVHVCERPSRTRRDALYRAEEIFGPDVAIEVVRTADEAVALNNQVPYGLVTSVFTRRRTRFEALACEIDTGLVNWNRATIVTSGLLPFGGTKASGNQRPAGLFAIQACVYPVAVLSDHRPAAAREWPPGFPAA